jgi:putative ABC transport system permease protein
MLTLLRTLSVGYLGLRPIRTILVVLSIALGVAVLVATQALGQAINKSIQDGVNPLAALADLFIVNAEAGMPAHLADDLRAAEIGGIARVTPFVYNRMSIADPEPSAPPAGPLPPERVVWLIGVEWDRKSEGHKAFGGDSLEGITVKQTWHPKTPLEKLSLLLYPPALVSENLAAELRQKYPPAHEGDPIRFRMRNAGQTPELTLLGTVDFSKSKLPLRDSHVVVTSLKLASVIRFPDYPSHVDLIGVSLEKGADPAAVQEVLQQRLGTRAQVQTLGESQQKITDVTMGLQIGLTIGGAAALVVGLFLVYNVLSVTIAERRHDIGILRSVGATRGQIAGLFLSEATCMGLIGATLGLPLGWALARLAVGPVAGVITDLLVPIDGARIELPIWLMVLAVLSGVLVANLAALVPALDGASEEPADAVRRIPRPPRLLYTLLQIGAVVALLLVGFGLARFRTSLPDRVGMFAGIVSILMSGLVAMPLVTRLIGKGLQPLFRHTLGLEGRLAADNLVRSSGRTGLVIGALAATCGLMVQTAGFIKSSREAIQEWVDEKIAADLFVSSGAGITSGGAALTMQESMREKLLAVPGVEAILPVRFNRVEFRPNGKDERIIWLVAIDTREFVHSAADRPLARSLQEFPRLREPGTVCVSENFAALYKIKVGDHLVIPGQNGAFDAEVIGTVVDYTWPRGTILMDLDWYRREFNDKQVNVFDVFLKPGTDVEETRREVMDRYGSAEALFVLTRPQVNEDIQKSMTSIYSLAYAQQTVIGLVALLGVVLSLYISVLQRTRDLGLLRAVGASRAQVLRSVLAEAVLMGMVGAILGMGIGVLLEWYVMDVLLLDESGFTFPLRIPWKEAGVVAAASVALATLAGLWPAYQATRLRIPEAIAYE